MPKFLKFTASVMTAPAPINISIKGDGGIVAIDVLGYENPNGTNDSDANWLASRVIVAVGPFCAKLDAALTTLDFIHFERDLDSMLRALSGKAEFQTDEESLRFTVHMGPQGVAMVNGIVRFIGETRASMEFSFPTDQTYLDRARYSLSKITKWFPVRSHGV